MMYLLWSVVGIFIGSIIGVLIFRAHSSNGTLRIDHTNPEKDVYRIEIDDFDKLSKKKRVILKVDNHADLSQK